MNAIRGAGPSGQQQTRLASDDAGSDVKILVTAIVPIAGLFLGIRDLPYVASPTGRCEIGQQPIIRAGEATSLTVQLECAIAAPSTPAPRAAPVSQPCTGTGGTRDHAFRQTS